MVSVINEDRVDGEDGKDGSVGQRILVAILIRIARWQLKKKGVWTYYHGWLNTIIDRQRSDRQLRQNSIIIYQVELTFSNPANTL